MTRKRMGEIALAIIKMHLQENTEFDEVADEDEEVEKISQELDIPRKEAKEFFNKIRDEAYREWIG